MRKFHVMMKIMRSDLVLNHKILYHCSLKIHRDNQILGGLAHLARALDWQSKGGRFDPDILHI